MARKGKTMDLYGTSKLMRKGLYNCKCGARATPLTILELGEPRLFQVSCEECETKTAILRDKKAVRKQWNRNFGVAPKIVVWSTEYCGSCRVVKNFLDENSMAFTVEEGTELADPSGPWREKGMAAVAALLRGNNTLPVVGIGDEAFTSTEIYAILEG